MKVRCLVSDNVGHLDFGGGGFLQLASALENQGHQVRWTTHGAAKQRLVEAGCPVAELGSISAIANPRWLSHDQVGRLRHEAEVLGDLLRSDRPDVCLVDRNLGLATMVVSSLDIPFASIGTPGGYWSRDRHGVIPLDRPDPEYSSLGDRLNDAVPWLRGTWQSFWQPSPHLNVVFMGRSFYPATGEGSTTAFVDLFGNRPDGSDRDRLGVAFGNTGDTDRMVRVLRAVDRRFGHLSAKVFIGGRESQREELQSAFPGHELLGWTDYSFAFSDLRAVACLGGIGTLWRCVEHVVPALVVPGGAGDQNFNAARVDELGLGSSTSIEPSDEAIDRALEQVMDFDGVDAITEFRARSNFTDSLESVVASLSAIAAS